MSRAKELLWEQEQRGWVLAPDDRYVCAGCVGDDGLIAVIRAEAAHFACSYCTRTGSEPIAIPVNRLFEVIASGVRYELTDPVNELPYEDGEYVFGEMIIDSHELLASEVPLISDGLIEEFLSSFSDLYWVKRDFFALPDDEALMVGWNDFATESIRATAPPERRPRTALAAEILPEQLLDRVGTAVTQAGVVRSLPAGTMIYRARVHRIGSSLRGAAALGAPPAAQATLPNRMSPAGQSMFYGALHEETSVEETLIRDGVHTATIGVFTTSEEIAVLDLTELPEVPSLFDEERRHARRPLMFLRAFAEEISKPVPRDGGESVQYIPTQRLTTYFRAEYEPPNVSSLMGILYRSSRNDRPCIVFFVGNCGAIDRADRSPSDTHLLTLESQHIAGTTSASSIT